MPGVELLELVMAAVGHGNPRLLGSLKFHQPVRPGEVFTLGYMLEGSSLRFSCTRGERLLVDGSVTLGVPTPGT